MNKYRKIAFFRLLDIEIMLDNKEIIYRGMVDEAPQEIRNLEYFKSEMGNPLRVYVCN